MLTLPQAKTPWVFPLEITLWSISLYWKTIRLDGSNSCDISWPHQPVCICVFELFVQYSHCTWLIVKVKQCVIVFVWVNGLNGWNVGIGNAIYTSENKSNYPTCNSPVSQCTVYNVSKANVNDLRRDRQIKGGSTCYRVNTPPPLSCLGSHIITFLFPYRVTAVTHNLKVDNKDRKTTGISNYEI